MAISNPQAVKFANERARVFADQMVSTYETARVLLAEWTAVSMGTLVPDNAAEVVQDGSATDGRSPINGQHINALVAAATAMVTWFETGTPSRITRCRQIAVNAQSRF